MAYMNEEALAHVYDLFENQDQMAPWIPTPAPAPPPLPPLPPPPTLVSFYELAGLPLCIRQALGDLQQWLPTLGPVVMDYLDPPIRYDPVVDPRTVTACTWELVSAVMLPDLARLVMDFQALPEWDRLKQDMRPTRGRQKPGLELTILPEEPMHMPCAHDTLDGHWIQFEPVLPCGNRSCDCMPVAIDVRIPRSFMRYDPHFGTAAWEQDTSAIRFDRYLPTDTLLNGDFSLCTTGSKWILSSFGVETRYRMHPTEYRAHPSSGIRSMSEALARGRVIANDKAARLLAPLHMSRGASNTHSYWRFDQGTAPDGSVGTLVSVFQIWHGKTALLSVQCLEQPQLSPTMHHFRTLTRNGQRVMVDEQLTRIPTNEFDLDQWEEIVW